MCSQPLLGQAEGNCSCQVLSYLKEKKVLKRFWPERLELIDWIPHTGSGKGGKISAAGRTGAQE